MADGAASVAADVLDRRTQILECTCRVIARDGADGLRMATVAAEVGVSSALLHYYFATREDLIRLAFEYHDHRETGRSLDRLQEIPDPVHRIRSVLVNELSDDAAVQEGWALWAEMERYSALREDFHASVCDRSARWIGLVAELVADAQATGRVPPEVDVYSAALRLTCVVDGLGSHANLGTITREAARLELDGTIRDILHLGLGRT